MEPRFYAFNGGETKHLDDLSYVLGVMIGDACLYRSPITHYRTSKPSYNWTIELHVRDLEFAQKFSERLSHVLKRPESRRPTTLVSSRTDIRRSGMHRVCKRSQSFGDWYTGLSPEEFATHALRHPADFLAGLYDSEGNLSMRKDGSINEIRILTASESTRDLAVRALDMLGVGGKWRLFRKAGTPVRIAGQPAHSGKDLFVVSPRNYRAFFQHVRSSIPRKNPPD